MLAAASVWWQADLLADLKHRLPISVAAGQALG